MVITLDITIMDIMVIINFMRTLNTHIRCFNEAFICLFFFFYLTKPVSFCDASEFKVG